MVTSGKTSVPTIVNLDDLISYSNMTIGNRLLVAVESGNLNDVNRMMDLITIEHNKNGDNYQSYYNEAMNIAAGKGYINIVNKMSNVHADNYNTALVSASANGHIKIVNLILNLEYTKDILLHALNVAAEYGHLNVVQRLMETGINITNLGSAISAAAYNEHLNIVKFLISVDVTFDMINCGGYMDNVVKRNDRDLIEEYLQLGADINEIMLSASKYGHIDIVNDMLNIYTGYEKDINTAVYYAFSNKHPKIALLLIKFGANNYEIIMNLAAENDYVDIIKYVLDSSVIAQYIINNALLQASKFDRLDAVNILLSYGATNIKNATIRAIENESSDTLQRLLEFDLLKDSDPFLILSTAIKTRNLEIVSILMKYYTDDKNFNNIINHLMNIAAEIGDIRIVKLLLENNATSINSTMNIAAKYGHLDIVKLMVETDGTNFLRAIDSAEKGEYYDIVEYLKSV